MRFLKFFIVVFVFAFVSCSDHKKPNFEYAPDMAHYRAYPTYSENPSLPSGKSALEPVEGTIPRGFEPFPYTNDPEGFERAGKELKNPFAQNKTALSEGKKLYEIYCMVCHGRYGRGDGPVAKNKQFPAPADFKSENVKKLADGQIYFAITYGFGSMSSYAGVLTPEERWKIVTYVRYLQNLKNVEAKSDTVAEVSAVYAKSSSSTGLVLVIYIGIFAASVLLSILRRSYFPLVLFGLIFVVSLFGFELFKWSSSLGRQKDYQPDQPVKFSHKIHAGQYQINCLYCHSGARKGPVAGVPSVELCMNCHKFIKEGKKTGTKEIKKLFDASLNWEPIKWIRVNHLPAHVRFNHAQHVKVAGIKCQKCHGPVESMDVVKQYASLSMGWCIDCHRKTAVDVKNGYYKNYGVKSSEKITIADIDKLDCQTCHY